MTEYPIIFSAPMVRAILDGSKTQTRRVVTDRTSVGNWKASELDLVNAWVDTGWPDADGVYRNQYLKAPLHPDVIAARGDDGIIDRLYCRYAVGDHLWVRETWSLSGNGPFYRADVRQPETVHYAWKPSIHMPRWASRITLEVVSVRVERLQDISEDDAYDEGIEPIVNDPTTDGYGEWQKPYVIAARDQYRELWDSLNANRGYGWDVNPWVWCIGFRRVP